MRHCEECIEKILALCDQRYERKQIVDGDYCNGSQMGKEMPLPTPKKRETFDSFIKRCIPFVIGEGHPSKQAAAICASQFDKKEKTNGSTSKKS